MSEIHAPSVSEVRLKELKKQEKIEEALDSVKSKSTQKHLKKLDDMAEEFIQILVEMFEKNKVHSEHGCDLLGIGEEYNHERILKKIQVYLGDSWVISYGDARVGSQYRSGFKIRPRK